MSFTSGIATHDPEPYMNNAPDFDRGSAEDLEEWQPRHGVTYDPRPEFDNHNPILVSLRRMQEIQPKVSPARRAGAYLASLDGFGIAIGAAPEHIAHARRVLEKLAALS